VDGVGASATGRGFWAGGGSLASVAFGVGFRDGVEGGLDVFLLGAGASAAMVAATRLSVSFDSGLQMSTLARLLAAVALDMGGARLAHGTAVRALRYRASLLVDVLERTV